MNNPRRIQRHLVKAIAAGALLAAAALPMAFATVAGAAGTDTVTLVTFDTTPSGGTTTANSYFGSGASGTAAVTGTFAGDGGNATITTNAPGVTFSGVVDTSTTGLTANFASTSATVPGTYNLTVTDNQGTGTETNAFIVYAAPTVSSISVPGAVDTATPTATALTLSGTGFVGTPTVIFTNTKDGTTLGPITVTPSGGTETSPVSTLGVSVTNTNSNTGNPASPGTYTVTVINPDGGAVTTAAIYTITGIEVSDASPSAIPAVATTSPVTVTVTGGGFENQATVTMSAACVTAGVKFDNAGTPATTVTGSVSSSTSLTVGVDNTATTPIQCSFTVTNNGPGGNGASFTATNVFGVGEASNYAPTITTSSLTTGTALEAGAPSGIVTFTGLGFSQYTTTGATSDIVGNADTHSLVSNCTGNSGTTLACEIVVNSGATGGSHTATLVNAVGAGQVAAGTGSIANAFTVDGPVIVSTAPAALAVGAKIGTALAVTGTGFLNTAVGSETGASLHVSSSYVSATSMTFVVTGSPTSADVGSSDVLHVSQTDAFGATVVAPVYHLTVNNAPSAAQLTYAVGTGVGVGATAQAVVIHGSNFEAGVTVGNFVNVAGVADPLVKATVTGLGAVNTAGTLINATIAIAAGDANTIDGYTITNPDGGTVTVPAVAPGGLVIDAGPTITAVSPSPVLASATNAITITGTNFAAGAVVTATANGSCATATVVSATSITVSCTFGVAQSTGTSLVVTNLDGGMATSAVVLPAVTVAKAPAFRVTGAHGVAVVGRTVRMTISGVGFFGQPRITSNAPGTRAVVTKDSGHLLTIRVTTKAGTRPGEHTFTIRLANGKTGRANYKIKK